MKTPSKLDLYHLHKADYAAPRKPTLIKMGPAVYLAIEGRGAPGGEEFTDRIGALYGVAFTVKMTRKFAGQQDYAVCKLEAQWWAADGSAHFACRPREEWCWKLLIRTPEFVKMDAVRKAVGRLMDKGKTAAVREVKREVLKEGGCVQMLHVGPYEREGDTVEQMRRFIEGKGLTWGGRHHEIYLSDPRRVAPERLRTILRIPVVTGQG